jgi:hypothetical protein
MDYGLRLRRHERSERNRDSCRAGSWSDRTLRGLVPKNQRCQYTNRRATIRVFESVVLLAISLAVVAPGISAHARRSRVPGNCVSLHCRGKRLTALRCHLTPIHRASEMEDVQSVAETTRPLSERYVCQICANLAAGETGNQRVTSGLRMR